MTKPREKTREELTAEMDRNAQSSLKSLELPAGKSVVLPGAGGAYNTGRGDCTMDTRRAARRMSAAMLALAVTIRLLTAAGWDRQVSAAVRAALQRPGFAGFLFYLETGQALALPELPASAGGAEPPQPTEGVPVVPLPRQGSGDPSQPLTFTEADAEAVTVGGACTYPVDKLALLQQPSVLDFDQDGPTVLIVHTHTSEAYTQEAGWEYPENEMARTQDTDFSVVRVGRELAETLEARGISVLHDESFNDYPTYSGAYDRTLEKIQQWVQRYPSIQMVIDVHRDAAANADGTPVRHAVTLDGQETAQVMLVVGTDQGGLSHPNWRDNLSWALKLQAVLERQYPGLCRNLDLRTERFNQHMTPGSLLIEVGSSGNTLREALAAARDVGEGLAALIAGT